MISELNPWDKTSVLDEYCDSILPRVGGISIKKQIVLDETNDLIEKLKKADQIIKEKRLNKLNRQVMELELEATSVFTDEFSQDVKLCCKGLIDVIQNVIKKISETNHSDVDINNEKIIHLDQISRNQLNLLIENITRLTSSNIDISEIKYEIEKLILEKKLHAMDTINRMRNIEDKLSSIFIQQN